jgi:diacylglycerol O-acyltransferase
VSLRSAGGLLRVDRLTGPDLGGFVPEKFGWPAEIGLIAVLDGAPLFDGDGRLRSADVRDRIASRLFLTPRLRQVVRRPGRLLGRPIWVDAPRFNIADHVRTFPLPAGAGQSELLQTCEELRQRPLDRSHPLWQLWLLPGLPGNEVGPGGERGRTGPARHGAGHPARPFAWAPPRKPVRRHACSAADR